MKALINRPITIKTDFPDYDSDFLNSCTIFHQVNGDEVIIHPQAIILDEVTHE